MTTIKHLAYVALAVALGATLPGCSGGEEKLLASARGHFAKKEQAQELAAAEIDLKSPLDKNP